MPTVVTISSILNPNIMKTNKNRSVAGQALIEYLLIFSFMTFISISMVKGLGKTLGNSVGNIGYELSEQFTVGVCKELCFFNGYKNQE